MKQAMLAGRDRAALLRQRELTYGVRTLLKKMVELLPFAGRAQAAGRCAAGRPRLQDPVRAARGRCHPLPALHWRAQERRRGLERRTRGGREAEPPVGSAGEGSIEVERLSAGRHRLRGQAPDTHTNDTFCRRDHPVRLPPIPFPDAVATSAVLVKQRGEEDKLAAGTSQAPRGRPDLPLRVQLGAGPDAYSRHGRAPLRHHSGSAGAEVRRARRADPPARGLSRDDQGQSRGPGQAQEAVGRAGPVRRLLDPDGAPAAGHRLRVRGRDRGRRDSQQVHPGGGSRCAGGGRAWCRGRLSAGGFSGRVLRRVVPRRGFQRDVVQDGRHPGLPERGARSAGRFCSSPWSTSRSGPPTMYWAT